MLGWLRKYGNESVEDWRHLLRKTVEAVPDVDSDGSILLMDDFKGGQGALNVFERDVQRFICTCHREQNIRGALGLYGFGSLDTSPPRQDSGKIGRSQETVPF